MQTLREGEDGAQETTALGSETRWSEILVMSQERSAGVPFTWRQDGKGVADRLEVMVVCIKAGDGDDIRGRGDIYAHRTPAGNAERWWDSGWWRFARASLSCLRCVR